MVKLSDKLEPGEAAAGSAENRDRGAGFAVLGAVFLVVTGGEALYADMGHFGRRPIKLAWFGLVLPALLLNYFGQAALLLGSPGAARNPFYLMAPAWALYPLVALSTTATVIASQAVISGAFSLTRQAVQLGYAPYMRIRHTSSEEIGQVFIPTVNWALMVVTIGLVLAFRRSTNLAGAYGIAVATTMVITTILAYKVAREREGWGLLLAGALAGLNLCAEKGLDLDPEETSYFISREIPVPSRKKGLALWRAKLFALMSSNAVRASSFFGIPPDQVIELGAEVEI